MYDLTHPVETGMQTYPGDPPVRATPAATHDADGYRVTELALGSHAGTHVDAPAHTEANGRTLGEYPPAAFVRDAVVVDCRDLGARAAVPAERVPDPVDAPGADCVLFRTGWDRHWGSERYRDHPYLSVAAAERCVEQGYAVGLDAFSPDPTPPADPAADERPPAGGTDGVEAVADRPPFGAHRALLGAGLLVFENLTNLDVVPPRVEIRAHPLAFDGDGAPVRAVAVDGGADVTD